MGLETVHSWADGEVIEADDLNSIKSGVSQELLSGSIPASKLVWPLIAQGNIDLNGYALKNFSSFLGAIHVNDEKTIAEAILEAEDGSVIVIDTGTTSPITLSNVTITGRNNLSIIGNGAATVAVGNAVTTAGLTIDGTCSNITIAGIKFTGGTVAKPAVLIAGATGTTVVNCQYETYVGITVSTVAGMAIDTTVKHNKFSGCDIGINIYSGKFSAFDENNFYDCTVGIHLPSDTEGEFTYNTVDYNKFRSIAATGSIYGYWTGTIGVGRGFNSISRNTFEQNSTYIDISVTGYYCNTYADNICSGPCVVSGSYNNIVDNVFQQAFSITGVGNKLDGNRFFGSVTRVSPTAGDKLNIINNTFHLAFTSANTGVTWFDGNFFMAGYTLSSAPDYPAVGQNAG